VTAATTGAALGLDAGSVRVGVAASDPTGTIATPVATLSRNDPQLWERISSEAAQRGAARIVVGLPRAMSGDEGAAAAAARDFAAEVGRRTGLPVELWDERLTTVQAERALVATGMRRRRRREVVDAVAAGLMLQAWLDRSRGPATR
jgi:putative holliday junction resolvase